MLPKYASCASLARRNVTRCCPVVGTVFGKSHRTTWIVQERSIHGPDRKGLNCAYGTQPPVSRVGSTKNARHGSSHGASLHTSLISPVAFSSTIPLEPSSLESSLYLQVHGLIRSTGQFVDDISARYFQGFHHHLPIISRTSFCNKLITLGAAPAADFSLLLLSICLITLPHESAQQSTYPTTTLSVDQQSLHLTARSLFSQVQVAFPPSLHLVQAGVWLAIYEYAQGHPDDAFAFMACCARMAYRLGMQRHCHKPSTSNKSVKIGSRKGSGLALKNREAINTWWGMIIWERYVLDNYHDKSNVEKSKDKFARWPC